MAAGGDSSKAVVLALVGNGLLTVIKFAAYFLSGSGAMLAEGIHSAADTGNQFLLFVGLKKSKQGPTEDFHFGYGKDRFLWALISAAGIFFIGCGVSMTHGIEHLLNPQPRAASGMIIWIVLGISLIVDGVVLATAINALNKSRDGVPWLLFLKTTDDTTTVAVLFEDGAACLGVMLAAAGIAASEFLGWHWADPAAAIAIGVLLGIIAMFLGAQNRSYLLDRAVSADVQARVLATIRDSSKSVERVADIKTRIVGADLFSFTADIEFDGKVLSDRIQQRLDVKKLYEELKNSEDLDKLMDQHAYLVIDELGREVDRIEAAVRAQVPGAGFIQLEPDGAQKK